MAVRLRRNVALAGKPEAQPGARETISLATDRIQILAGAVPQRDYIARNSRSDFLTGSLSREKDAEPVGEFVRIPIRFAPQGSGAAYSASVLPPHHPFFLAAGFGANVDTTGGSEKVTYSLADFPEGSASFDYYYSGLRYEIAGAVLENLTITCDAGGFPLCDATLIGRLVTVADAMPFSIPSYPQVQSLIWSGNGALTLGVTSPQVQRISFALANTVQPNVDANADALAFFQIVDRDPTAEVSIRVPAIATYDPVALMNSRTEFALAARFGRDAAPGQYKRMRAASGRAYYRDVQPAEDGEFLNYNLTVAFAEHASELDFVFD